jgi:enamine deaminase RidA (YjgF/YER057c/UK114 family)
MVKNLTEGRECSIAVVQGNMHSTLAKTNDVSLSISGQIGEKTRVFLDTPTTSALAKAMQNRLGWLEGAITVAETNEH